MRHVIALAGRPAVAGEAAADELTLARLLAPGRPLRFAHPILRAAVEAELPPAGRAAARRRADDGAGRRAGHGGSGGRSPAGLRAGRRRVGGPAAAGRRRARDRPRRARGRRPAARARPARACDEPALRLALGRAYRLAGGSAAPRRCWSWRSRGARSAGARRITQELATALALSARGEEAVALLEREPAGLRPGAGSGAGCSRRSSRSQLIDSLAADPPRASSARRRGCRRLGGGGGAAGLARADPRANRHAGSGGAAEAAERALEAEGVQHGEAPGALVLVFVSLVLLAGTATRTRSAGWSGWSTSPPGGAELTLGLAELGLGRVRLFRGELAPASAAVERCSTAR